MKTILIVDDSPTIRRMVRASLQSISEVEIVEASSGLEAVEKIAIAPVNLMVLDMNMPDMHGLDVLRFLRSSGKETHVIVLTTKGDDETKKACLNAGASLFMNKPFEPKTLAERVTDLLGASAPS